MNPALDTETLVLATLVFISLLMLAEGLYLLWAAGRSRTASRLRERLHGLAAATAARHRANVVRDRRLSNVPQIDRLLGLLPDSWRLERLQGRILQAGMTWTVGQMVMGSALLALAALVTANAIALSGPLAMAAAAVGGCLPWLLLEAIRGRRMARLAAQLPDALDFLTRAMRAGHALSSALMMAGEEMPSPIGPELRFTHDEINFGIPLNQALANLCERVPSADMRYFAVAVLVQRESGGNLAEILGNLSRLIRERYKLYARVKVLSADGRLSALILVLAPFVLGGLMYTFNPGFMAPLWEDSMGQSMTKTLLVLMVLGIFVLSRIIRIRV